MFDYYRSSVPVEVDLSLPNTGRRVLRQSFTNFVEAGFLAAGPGVEYEDSHQFVGATKS
jgi:hypothetical protein